jgi:hypothetical protein
MQPVLVLCSQDGTTLLHVASREGRSEFSDQLIKARANVNAVMQVLIEISIRQEHQFFGE